MTGSSCLANLATIAWDVYNSCRDGPDELRSIAAHIFALHTSITLLSSRNLDIFAQDWLLRLTEDCQQALCAINSRSCHANKAHNNASQTLTEITEQLIRITAAFTAVHAVLVNCRNHPEQANNKLDVILSSPRPSSDGRLVSQLEPDGYHTRSIAQTMFPTPRKRVTLKKTLRGFSTRMSNSKSAVISTDNVPRSPKHLQLSAHVQSPQTVESPPLGAATELSSSLSPTKKSFKPHESAERLFNVTMVKSSSGNVTGNARFTPRPKSEAHRKIRKPVPARLSQPEEVTRLRSLSEDPAFTAISSHVNSDQPVYQNQSCGLGSSTSSQGRERTDSIGTSWATESSEPTSWVRQSYDSSAGQLVSRTSRASSSWNSQEKETFEKHEAVIKNSYLGRTAEQEARMESTRRSLQLRTNLGAAAPPPPFHRLASSSGLDSPYLLGMEIALPSPDLQVRMETAPRRHTQPTLCHNSNSLYDHDSYQSVRELAEPDKATNNSVVSSDSPEQTNTGVNINTSYLSSLQSIGPPMQTLDSTADGINLDTAIYSPLLVAVANGESEKVRSLIYSGESILQLTPDPLQLAVANNDLATVKAILESVPSNSIPKFWESTVLHTAARTGHLDIARVLLEHGATVHYQGKEGKTPLHIAARNGAIHILNLLLDFDDQPNCFSIAANRSPLGDAAIGGHVGTLEILLERGTYAPADIDQALMYAAKYGNISTMEYLIGRGAAINPPLGQRTALHEACCTGGLAAAKLLLNAGALVNKADHKGQVPLHAAAAHFEPEIVRLLLRAGPECSALRDRDDRTPLDLARERYEDNAAVIRILERHVAHQLEQPLEQPGATEVITG